MAPPRPGVGRKVVTGRREGLNAVGAPPRVGLDVMVGLSEGRMTEVGPRDIPGVRVATRDGLSEGLPDGLAVTDMAGPPEGLLVGLVVGDMTGTPVGSVVGPLVGINDGRIDGGRGFTDTTGIGTGTGTG